MVAPPRRVGRPVLTVVALCLLVSAYTSALAGCAASRNSALGDDDSEIVQAKKQGDQARTLATADEAWEARKDRAKLQEAIDLYSQALEMGSPELSEAERKTRLADTYERLSRAHYFMADSHIRMSDMDQKEREAKMVEVYEQGITAAENAIVLRDPNLASAISGGDKLRKIVGEADPSAIPSLYWYATNLGKWGLLKGITTILKYKEDIRATMDFICKTDAEFYYGGCHRYFGAYWTKIPFGKDPEKSKKNFETSIEMAPNYLATKVLMANYYAELAQNPDLYKKLLTEVVETDLSDSPELEPENYWEQQKAKRLLKQTEDKFY